MAWHNLLVTEAAHLSVKNSQLLCRQDDQNLAVPLEDIASITLESLKTTVTSRLLSCLAKNNTVLITCDEQHHPNGIMLPLAQHSRQLPVLHSQIAMRAPFKKRLWQKIVRQKIVNQALILDWRHVKSTNRLKRLAASVTSGDAGNCEATAARLYFDSLFADFKRHDGGYINSALNYGYAIIRAAIARELVSYGFHPTLGLHHASELNSFNLADDLLEPYRAILDSWAIQMLKLTEKDPLDNTDTKMLTKENRATLTQILQLQVLINNQKHTLQTAVRLTVKSLVRCIKSKDFGLSLPEPLFPPSLKSLS